MIMREWCDFFKERLSLLNGYNEIIFKEILKIGEHTEQPSTTEKKVSIDLNVKGPVAYMWLTIQSREDLENGNWTKLCDDYGMDYIKEFMLITGTTAREDGKWLNYDNEPQVYQQHSIEPVKFWNALEMESDDTSI
jgi:hypothetical protein